MKNVTKLAAVVAITAAVVFPGVAALAETGDSNSQQTQQSVSGKRPAPPKPSEIKKKQEAKKAAHESSNDALEACRAKNKKAQLDFVKASKDAVEAKNLALQKARKDFVDVVKAAGDDVDAKKAAMEKRKVAIKSAQEAFQKAKQKANDTRKSSSEKCVPSTSNQSIQSTQPSGTAN